MSKLIKMTDFVLEVEKNSYTETEKYNIIEWQTKCDSFDKIVNYTKFLKQPLSKGMFVPCDEDGNVLENPFACDKDSGSEKEFLQIKYNNAKEKVIFKGFWLDKTEKIQLLTNGKVFIFFAFRNCD